MWRMVQSARLQRFMMSHRRQYEMWVRRGALANFCRLAPGRDRSMGQAVQLRQHLPGTTWMRTGG